MMNGSGPKNKNDALSNLGTDADMAELRREREVTNEALEELDRLLPSDDVPTDWDEEVTQAGAGARRRTITLPDTEDALELTTDALKLFSGNAWRLAALLVIAGSIVVIFAIWQLKDKIQLAPTSQSSTQAR